MNSWKQWEEAQSESASISIKKCVCLKLHSCTWVTKAVCSFAWFATTTFVCFQMRTETSYQSNDLQFDLLPSVPRRYPEMASEENKKILLVLAAGWNTEDGQYDCLDSDGHCWRKTDLVALAELCALNGHPFSCFNAKFEQLHNSCMDEHIPFIFQNVGSIKALSPRDSPPRKPLSSRPSQQLLDLSRKRPRERTQAEELAEVTGLPLDTAEGIIAAAGGLSKALELPMFQATFQKLQACHQAVDLDDLDSDHDPSPKVTNSCNSSVNLALEELLSMGFSRLAAENALQCANGNLSQAVEDLLSAWKKRHKRAIGLPGN